MTETIAIGDEQLCVFETRGCRNYCVPRVRLWIRSMHMRTGNGNPRDVRRLQPRKFVRVNFVLSLRSIFARGPSFW